MALDPKPIHPTGDAADAMAEVFARIKVEAKAREDVAMEKLAAKLGGPGRRQADEAAQLVAGGFPSKRRIDRVG